MMRVKSVTCPDVEIEGKEAHTMMGFGGLGMLAMMFFWVFVVVLAVWLLSRLFPSVAGDSTNRGSQQGRGTSTTALDILKQRYARGEISRVEYEDMRQGLQA
jgi:putative membrane protein